MKSSKKAAVVGTVALVASTLFAPGDAEATGATYTAWGCTITQNVVQSAANSTTALGSTYTSASSGCSGTRTRLGYRRNGTNYISSTATDTDPSNQYNAVVSRSNATARYVKSSARSGGGTWSSYRTLWA